ncbi:uncharacterized protein [Epargyreus clarus]|uniref:uncharacterized protein n=1 Tax=Epargyreus clarus TaxID=520877 RepID=UPI003C2F65E2
MSEKLRDYQVLDVLCGGTFYKVKHKVTNNIFAWKAYNCSAYSDEQIQNVVNEVRTISKVLSGNLLRYYDTILHGPSKTLYFVLEYNSWQSVQELIAVCKATDKYFTETFIWYLLLELARACKIIEGYSFVALQKCISLASIFVGENGDVRVNCFELHSTPTEAPDLVQQIGDVIKTLCFRTGSYNEKIREFYYSDDLRDVVSFLTDDRNTNLRPDVVLYHPTVLANADALARPKYLIDILVPAEYSHSNSEVNKCDSEKAVELCKTIEPLPRTHINTAESPIYCNISPKRNSIKQIEETTSARGSLSPTLAALALELPGYVPRSRKPYSEALDTYNGPQRVSEETFSQQWMSRLIALRQREESVNKRERDLIAKEIVYSPSTKMIPSSDSQEKYESNGITLPPVVTQGGEDKSQWVSRRRQRRAGSVRTRARRKSYAYEDLDSSLSADAGDSSIVVTATKFTKDNMPRRNIFPDLSSKKVHFTSSNPFVESDESVTLTFYDLDSVESGCNHENSHQKADGKVLKDITKFKYLDVDKVTSEKRAAKQWSHSPSKQAKIVGQIFADITNHGGLLKKTPSKTSLTSKCTGVSSGSQWSVETRNGKVLQDSASDRTRASFRQSIAHTPTAPPELKKTKSRKSLLPFKTPFKLRSVSTKI